MASVAVSLLTGHFWPSLSACRPSSTSWPVILTLFALSVSHVLAVPAAPVETLVLDRRAPFRDASGWHMLSEHDLAWHKFRQRAEEGEIETATATSSTASVTSTFSIALSTVKPTTTTSISTSTSIPAPSSLPTIFDTLAINWVPADDGGTPPCMEFINSFLADPTFQECYPLSMLMHSSRSFFEAQRSMVGITRTLDATCAANATACAKFMTNLSKNLIASENCGAEFQANDPAIVDAYNAMRAYLPIYSAGCLRDPETNAYCYASAVTNMTSPANTYVYFLPLNRSLPGSSIPACNWCLQQTMAIYQDATADRNQLISLTYVSAAKQINTNCGPTFVNESLAEEITSIAHRVLTDMNFVSLTTILSAVVVVLWLI